MRRSVFVLCVLGLTFLVVGSVLAVPSVRNGVSQTITSTGRIAHSDGAPQQTNSEISFDLLGYAAILASVGFFAVAFLWNRRFG